MATGPDQRPVSRWREDWLTVAVVVFLVTSAMGTGVVGAVEVGLAHLHGGQSDGAALGQSSGANTADLAEPTSGLTGNQSLAAADTKVTGAGANDTFGAALTHGDVNGDGVEPGALNLSNATGVLTGEGPSDRAGWSLDGIGDHSGDFVVGAPNNGCTAADAGAAYLLAGDCPDPKPTPTETPEPTLEELEISKECVDEDGEVTVTNPNDVGVTLTFEGEEYHLAPSGEAGDSVTVDDLDVTIGTDVCDGDDRTLGTVRGVTEDGSAVATEEGIEVLPIEHERAGHEFGEAELLWRCADYGEIPDECPSCGADRTALCYLDRGLSARCRRSSARHDRGIGSERSAIAGVPGLHDHGIGSERSAVADRWSRAAIGVTPYSPNPAAGPGSLRPSPRPSRR